MKSLWPTLGEVILVAIVIVPHFRLSYLLPKNFHQFSVKFFTWNFNMGYFGPLGSHTTLNYITHIGVNQVKWVSLQFAEGQ
jgi:hypothetical protein